MANTANRWDTVPASLRKGDRLIDKAKPFEEIAVYLAPFQAEQTNYQTSYQSWLEARRVERVALGEQHVAESVVGNERRALGFAIIAAGLGRRNSTVYRNYFSKGYGPTLRLGTRESLAFTSGLIASLENETHPDIAARRDRLVAAYDGLTAALAKRQGTSDALAKAKSLLEDEGWEWRKAFNSFYFALRVHFPDRRPWVESLFRVSGNRVVEEEETPEGTEDTPEGTEETPNPEAPAAPEPQPGPAGGDVVPVPVTPPHED